MELMSTAFRRGLFFSLLVLLACALSWHAILSFCIREVAFWKSGCALSYRELRLEKGAIVLYDARLSGQPSYELLADRIFIDFWKTKPAAIRFYRPHLILPQGISADLFQGQVGKRQMALIAEDGTFEILGAHPFNGRFSFQDSRLILLGEDGKMELSCLDSAIDLNFENWPLAPFSKMLQSPEISSLTGSLSGFLHLSKCKTIGRLRLEDAGWISSKWQAAGGIERVDLDGEANCALADLLSGQFDTERLQRMKIQLQGSCAVRGSSRLDSLSGLFFFNQGIGIRWELEGNSFAWSGKSFFRNEDSEWLQSRLEFSGATASIGMEKEEGSRHWTLALDRANAEFFQMLSDFGPGIEWSCRLKSGELSAQFSCKEKEGELEEWNVASLEGRDLGLYSSDGDFFAAHLSASASCKENDRMQFDGKLDLKKGSGSADRFRAEDLDATVAIVSGEIIEGVAVASVNGLDAEAMFSGSLKEILGDLRIRGTWEHFGALAGLKAENCYLEFVEAALLLKGDWNNFLATFHLPFLAGEEIEGRAVVEQGEIREASIEAYHFDLVHLEPFCDFECAGIADLAMRYADEKWTAHLLGEDLSIKTNEASLWLPALNLSGESVESRWSASAEKVSGEVSFLGEAIPFAGVVVWDDGLLSVQVEKGSFAGIDFEGLWHSALQEGIPFSFEAKKLHGRFDELAALFGYNMQGKIDCRDHFCVDGLLLADPKSWHWSTSLALSEFCYGAVQGVRAELTANSETGLLECAQLQGNLIANEASFPFRGASTYKEGTWLFELRLEDHFHDLARLFGSASKDSNGISLTIDPMKSHFLGSPLHVQECRASGYTLDDLKLKMDLSCAALRSAQRSLEKIDKRFSTFREMPLEGTSSIEIDLRSKSPSLVRVQGEDLLWKNQSTPFQFVLLQNKEKWKVESLQIGDYAGSASLSKEEEGCWKIESGEVRYKNGVEAEISGSLGPALKCDLAVDSLLIDLKKADLEEIASFEGKVTGGGFLSMEWKNDLLFDVDLDLSSTPLQCGELFVENSGPLQLHFSKRQGLLIRGLDLQVQKTDCDSSSLYGRIGLMQYDFQKNRCFLHHSHLRLPIGSFSLLLKKFGENHPVARFLESLDPKNDLECSAELSFSDDLTSISCFMKEGFIPFMGAVRHLQNVDLQYSKDEASIDFLALHQGHSLKIGAIVNLDHLTGTLILEDEGAPLSLDERPMTLQGELHPEKGLLLHSIEGAFGGVDASFHEEMRIDGSGLIGTAKIDFAALSELLSPRIGKVFNELKMGKGYELKGRLFYGQGWSNPIFKGLLSGKNCELFGWQVRSFLSQIEAGASLVRLFELKGSDSAGILKINELTMSQSKEEPWKIAMPLFTLQEFRPSLLQKIGRDVGPVGPLVVRELKVTDFQGELEESHTYTAKGDLSFINSFKREHTVFDIPADVLGRIFGLDLELLIPVKGNLTFELKEGKFFLDELHDAYSEGKRSKFFLVKEGESPTVDLDGNVNILVKMKQYVLFKFTENFLLSIDGTMDTPSYSLQKKSRIQKLSGL